MVEMEIVVTGPAGAAGAEVGAGAAGPAGAEEAGCWGELAKLAGEDTGAGETGAAGELGVA